MQVCQSKPQTFHIILAGSSSSDHAQQSLSTCCSYCFDILNCNSATPCKSPSLTLYSNVWLYVCFMHKSSYQDDITKGACTPNEVGTAIQMGCWYQVFKVSQTCRNHLQSLLCAAHAFLLRSSEQSFLDWYFRYDTLSLPFQYNANAHQHPDLATQGTVTGLQPTLVHFADKKPWEVPTDDPLHKYANPCSSEFPVLKPVQRSMPAHARERRKSRRRRRHSFPSIWHI